ncbi:hypothetical protein BIY21_20810 [Vibrio ponticus]|uniref:Uncharacterized protein n=1 Tax=Vibrio ponticus TaxID=265668 RepID=A0ABX3FMP6_9VIBR|nr:hypothetical protein [Vibrio ponticus]OLQ95318.1 hypothetical protein BIY21_20810 [Vibrio ponticus]
MKELSLNESKLVVGGGWFDDVKTVAKAVVKRQPIRLAFHSRKLNSNEDKELRKLRRSDHAKREGRTQRGSGGRLIEN